VRSRLQQVAVNPLERQEAVSVRAGPSRLEVMVGRWGSICGVEDAQLPNDNSENDRARANNESKTEAGRLPSWVLARSVGPSIFSPNLT
jgi:hypothetical protein